MNPEIGGLRDEYKQRLDMTRRYVDAYRRYCWSVTSLQDLRLAPFHLLASAGHVHVDQDHVWHMEMLSRLCASDSHFLVATPWRKVALADPASEAETAAWWQSLTEACGEGMVVKPLHFVHRGPPRHRADSRQCRGREYLRIIYGPEYTRPNTWHDYGNAH